MATALPAFETTPGLSNKTAIADNRKKASEQSITNPGTLHIYSDGSFDQRKKIGTYGVHYKDFVCPAEYGHVPGCYRVNSTLADIFAVYRAIQSVPDSFRTRDIVVHTVNYGSLEDINSKDDLSKQLLHKIKSSAGRIKSSKGNLTFEKVQSGKHGNNHADKLCYMLLASTRNQEPHSQYKKQSKKKGYNISQSYDNLQMSQQAINGVQKKWTLSTGF